MASRRIVGGEVGGVRGQESLGGELSAHNTGPVKAAALFPRRLFFSTVSITPDAGRKTGRQGANTR
jgi:hypothetical protein